MKFHSVDFFASGRGKAQCAPDPAWPTGKDLLVARPEETSCLVKLPYPAPECGCWVVHCELCNLSVAITAAGRADDPRSVLLPCSRLGAHQGGVS